MPHNLVQVPVKYEDWITSQLLYFSKISFIKCLVQYILLSPWARCSSTYSSSSTDVTVCGLPLLFTPLHACEIQSVAQLKDRSSICRELRRLIQICHMSEFFNHLYLHQVKVWGISSHCIVPNNNQWDQCTYCWNYSFACESKLSLGAKLIYNFLSCLSIRWSTPWLYHLAHWPSSRLQVMLCSKISIMYRYIPAPRQLSSFNTLSDVDIPVLQSTSVTAR